MPRAFSLLSTACRALYRRWIDAGMHAMQRGALSGKRNIFVAFLFFLSASVLAQTGLAQTSFAQTGQGPLCRQLVLEGEAKQGVEWQAAIGQPGGSSGNGESWLIRLVPVHASVAANGAAAAQSLSEGWALALSPANDQDYPDALLLASAPYGSLNSREIATTYGMRAQDAIAWSPRHFHFFVSEPDLVHARVLYRTLLDTKSSAAGREQASAELLALSTARNGIAAGRLDILGAHLIAGSGDPAPFAAQWAATLGGIPHTLDPDGGKSSPQGELHSLHFKITLWLPASWKASSGRSAALARCAE